MQFPESDFWDFSIDFYSVKEVEKNCLNLQDKFELNVNLVLFCYWLAIKKKNIANEHQWQQLFSATLPWEEIIRPLRLSRKMINHSSIAWPADFKVETKKSVSAIEINTEHMQQLSIEQAWQQMGITKSEKSYEDIINNNIKNYLKAIESKFTIDAISNETNSLLEACLEYHENSKTIAL
jgi:uncharacterized protein (TIGR02444 family)